MVEFLRSQLFKQITVMFLQKDCFVFAFRRSGLKLPHVTASGHLWGKVKLYIHFHDLHKVTGRWFRLLEHTTPNPVDGLYKNVTDFLQFRRQGFWWQSMTMKETVLRLPCKCGISCFISAENPDFSPSITGAPPVHTEPIVGIFSSCFAKKSFTNWNTSFALVAVSGCSQKRKFLVNCGTIMDIPHQCIKLTAIRNRKTGGRLSSD